MKRKIFLTFLICLVSAFHLFAQSNLFKKTADSLYKIKEYDKSAVAYKVAADSSKANSIKKVCHYNAACCYALINDTANAIINLQKAVYDFGYKSNNLFADKDLISIHGTTAWQEIAGYLQDHYKALGDPAHAKLITTDIHHFWAAYDAAQKDTVNMKEIFQAGYFDKATPGLEDYFATKIGSIDAFVNNQKAKPKFYAAIRHNTLSVDVMKEAIYRDFARFKGLYEDAIFPDIYFVIGRWNSAGTVSDNGLLLGIDQIAKSDDIPTGELNLWEQRGFREVKGLPIIVAHELIHSQQDKLKNDTTLLSYAIAEGMADFFAEMITGINPSQRQYDFAKDKRKQIWEDFEKEMWLDTYANWIANGDQETADHPSDLGYYMGYEICKSYYDEMTDKRQAIIDIFNIQDYKAFLEKSRYAEKMAALP